MHQWIALAAAFALGVLIGVLLLRGARNSTPSARPEPAAPAAAPQADDRLRAARAESASLRARLAQAEAALRAARRGG